MNKVDGAVDADQEHLDHKTSSFEQEVRDLPNQDPVIYSDEYYSELLNSLNFGQREIDSSSFNFTSSQGKSEVEDDRSPFLYMRGGVRTMRLLKKLRGKDENFSEEVNKKKKEELNRELKRTAYICEKEAKERIKARHINVVQGALENVRTQVRLSLKERIIEKQLLAPYRHNEDLTQLLLRRYDQANGKRREKIKSARGSRPKSAHRVQNLEERLQTVKEKREFMIAQQLVSRELLNQEKEKRSNRLLINAARGISEMRVIKWLVIVTALSKLGSLYNVVSKVRQMKKLDIVSWKASKIIQRAWRRYTQPVIHVSLLDKMKTSMGGKENQEIYQQRIEAGDLIGKFLRRHYIAGKVWIYLRKVRKSQGYFRRHRTVNSARILLLSKYFQECLLLLTLQVNLILSNKGLDIRGSMTSFEINNMRNTINTMTSTIYNQRPGKPVAGSSFYPADSFLIGNVFRDFFTAEFHGFMRSKTKQLIIFQREFLQDVTQNSPQYHHVPFHMIELQFRRLWLDYPALKRKLLLAFLIQKRRKFIDSLLVREPLQIIIPTVSTNEANRFIRGGEDPLLSHLESISQQIQTWQEKQSLPMYPFRRPREYVIRLENSSSTAASEETFDEDWICPIMLLLSDITATDVFTFFLELGELIITYLFQEREKKLKMEQFGLLNVHRRLSVAMTSADHESGQRRDSKILSRYRRSSKDKVPTGNKKPNEEDISSSTQSSREGSRRNSRSNGAYVNSSVNPVPPLDKQQRSAYSTRKSVHKLVSTN